MIDKSMRVHLGHTIAGNLKDFGDTAYPPYIPEDYALSLIAEALQPWVDLMGESEGVAGFHLNGDIAEWDWLDMPETPEDAIAARAKRDGEIRSKAVAEAAARIEALQAEKDAAVLAEREACAKTVEGLYGLGFVDAGGIGPVPTYKYVSAAIRARSNKEPGE